MHPGGLRTALGVILPPRPPAPDNMDPEDARALRSYLYQMQEQLQYVLTNLDTENMSDTLRSKLQGL